MAAAKMHVGLGAGGQGWGKGLGLAVLLVGVVGTVTACSTAKQVTTEVTENVRDTVRDVVVKPSEEPVKALGQEPDIRVRVAAGVVEKEIAGPNFLAARYAGQPVMGKPVLLASPVRATMGPRGLTLLDAKGMKTEWGVGRDIEVLVADSAGALKADPIRVDKVAYPGFVTLMGDWKGSLSGQGAAKFDVVGSMGIESYLPGVLSHELLKDWPLQTYAAQAVAARSYAMHERERARAEQRGYDVEATTMDQVFGGTSQSVVANEAVRITRGQVMVYDAKILRAYFSSCCGGRAASASKVWPNPELYAFNSVAPLQGVPRRFECQKATYYRWEVRRGDEDVNQRIRNWGKWQKRDVANLTRLRKVEVNERNLADRPNSYKLTDEGGNVYYLRAEELRNSLNAQAPGLPALNRETQVKSGDVDVEIVADVVTIRGRGWGHGVGACQWCMKGMADAGYDYPQMLLGFYPGAKLQKVY